MHLLEGYALCENLTPWALIHHGRMTADMQRQLWSTRLTQQLAGWREFAVSASGALGVVGMVVGAAAASASEEEEQAFGSEAYEVF